MFQLPPPPLIPAESCPWCRRFPPGCLTPWRDRGVVAGASCSAASALRHLPLSLPGAARRVRGTLFEMLAFYFLLLCLVDHLRLVVVRFFLGFFL